MGSGLSRLPGFRLELGESDRKEASMIRSALNRSDCIALHRVETDRSKPDRIGSDQIAASLIIWGRIELIQNGCYETTSQRIGLD